MGHGTIPTTDGVVVCGCVSLVDGLIPRTEAMSFFSNIRLVFAGPISTCSEVDLIIRILSVPQL